MIPNPTRPDYYWENQYYWDDEKAERHRVQRSVEASNKVSRIWLSAFSTILLVAFVWSASLITAYLLWRGSSIWLSAAVWKKVMLVITTAYAVQCLVFFLKGMMVALQSLQRTTWILLWIGITSFVCLPPAAFAYLLVNSWIGPTPAHPEGRVVNHALCSIAAGFLAAMLVYFKTGMSANKCLKICQWAFKMGYCTVKNKY